MSHDNVRYKSRVHRVAHSSKPLYCLIQVSRFTDPRLIEQSAKAVNGVIV